MAIDVVQYCACDLGLTEAKREYLYTAFYLQQEDAKDAFIELLVSANVGSEWSWEQTMRHIMSDPRFESCALSNLITVSTIYTLFFPPPVP